MSEIQRIWANEIASGYPMDDPQLNCEYVTYADHVAAIEAAEQRHNLGCSECVNAVWVTALDKVLEAVDEEFPEWRYPSENAGMKAAVNKLRGAQS